LRTEFLYQNRSDPPSELEQVQVYRQLAEALKPHVVVVRTLDVGGDKLPAYLSLPAEANPYLGLRGIRVSLGTELEFVIMVIAVSCVKLLSAHNSTQHTSRKHKV
jgi:Phosphoenolpyruvate-protein kinase (PTS system EI component in bacteria)